MGLLDGVKVVDLSRVMAGPYCTALMADLGAEVIKIESPGTGDDARAFGPFVDERSLYFALLNRNKKSVTLNLKSEEGRELLYRLVADADVVVENFRPGVAQRLGVDYAALAARNPALVYLSISGFGQTGPDRDRPAYDLVMQAMSGLMSVTGEADGEPTCVGESVADLWTGLFGSWALMSALFARERSGHGQYIDLAMFDAMMSMQMTGLSRLFAEQQPPRRVGNQHPVTVPVDSFPARDGHVVMVVSSTPAFRRFAAMLGRPDLSGDPRFADNPARRRHAKELREMIVAWTSTRTVDELLACCLEADIPAGPVWDLQRAFQHASVRGDHFIRPLAHPVFGSLPYVRQPARFTDAADASQREPMLGEHNEEVLGMLGLSAGQLDALKERGVL